jgi:hypothetical protein
MPKLEKDVCNTLKFHANNCNNYLTDFHHTGHRNSLSTKSTYLHSPSNKSHCKPEMSTPTTNYTNAENHSLDIVTYFVVLTEVSLLLFKLTFSSNWRQQTSQQ